MQILSGLFGSIQECSIKLQKGFQQLFWKKMLGKPHTIMLWDGRTGHALQGNSSHFMRRKFHAMLQAAEFSCMFLYCCRMVFGHPNFRLIAYSTIIYLCKWNLLQICIHYLSGLVCYWFFFNHKQAILKYPSKALFLWNLTLVMAKFKSVAKTAGCCTKSLNISSEEHPWRHMVSTKGAVYKMFCLLWLIFFLLKATERSSDSSFPAKERHWAL